MKENTRLHLFNPDCELAIANGGRHYMPSANVMRMASDLAFLPAWWAEEGDWVLVKEPVDEAFGKELGIRVRCVTEEELAGETANVVGVPWGRSPRMCHWLAERWMGEEWQEEWKEWYSRRTARRGLVYLSERMPLEEKIVPQVCFSLEEIKRRMADSEGEWLIKAPWSSSGKGQLRGKGAFIPKVQEWINGVFKKQGYVMLERYLDKVRDFAMEFQATGKGMEFIGWSFFTTGEHGEYHGNMIAPQSQMECELVRLIGEETVQSLKCHLPRMLETLLPDYRGYLGVDMMVYRDSESVLRVYPCVEINLRFNMGLVALFLSRKYVAEGMEGEFTVSFYNRDGEACEETGRLFREYPAVYENNRIKSGYLSLTPVKESSRFVASLLCY